jgi:TonB-dependent SusC/RagA subfamily outer membrane receptor
MQFSFAQEKTVTGVVSDELGPVVGATVIVKGTKSVVLTDFDGKYSIKAKSGDVLEVSYFDMKQIVTIGVSNSYNVTLKAVVLKEVVVVAGYKTETKAKSIGASTVVSSETIENRPNVSAIQTLQGQVAGFNIITGSGQPGEVSNTLIRGVGSVNGNTEPLYVIDGVPQSGSSFRAINSEDIESINVLRDAVATSIYGNRGGNGVVIVTTKKGKLGKSEIIFTSTTGVSVLQSQFYDKMSSKELLRIEKAKGTGFGNSLTDQQINSFNTNTDWSDVLLRTALTQNVNLSFSNGNEKMRSFNSISYNQSEGLAQVSKFRRITFRNNSDGKALNDKLEYSTNISLGYVMDDRVPSLGSGSVNQNPLLGSLTGLPYLSPSDYQNGRQLNELVRYRIPTSP